MVDRVDPARTGVKAGRVVGVLTAGLAAWSLLSVQDSYYATTDVFLDVVGIAAWVPVWTVFWGNVAFAVVARYSITYIVGSLVGVVYDWLDRPPVVALLAIVGVVAVVDAAFAFLDTHNPLTSLGYVVSWFVYVPVFVYLFDEETQTETGPRRL